MSLSNHCSNGSNNIKKQNGLRMSPCIVRRWIEIGLVLIKCVPINAVCELACMLPISLIASSGYPKSTIMASNVAWSMDPKALVKSI